MHDKGDIIIYLEAVKPLNCLIYVIEWYEHKKPRDSQTNSPDSIVLPSHAKLSSTWNRSKLLSFWAKSWDAWNIIGASGQDNLVDGLSGIDFDFPVSIYQSDFHI